MIKPTKDSFGNKVSAETCVEAVKIEEGGITTLKDLLPLITIDVAIQIETGGWTQATGTSYAFYKQFEVTDIRETDYPFYVLKPENGKTATAEEEDAYSKIVQIETFDGYIRVYVEEIPSYNSTILLKNIPNRSMKVSE